MFASYLNRIGIVKRTTERLSRRRAARESQANNTLDREDRKKQPEPRNSSPVMEDEDYLLVDIKDDGTAEASRVDPGCSLSLALPEQRVPDPKSIDTPALGDKSFENIPL
ncbi:hypothetical protein Q9L58_005684 [Maublancomyces gigas]|uniref:Uncharacterized protein n=1 Tax=Discina gigas TaxID=1032678 RepID=A0ABR3GHP2_9PEZI